jgi:dTMP kinase
MEEKTLVYHQSVRQGYLALAAAEAQRWLVVDASQPVETVHEAILARVHQLAPVGGQPWAKRP